MKKDKELCPLCKLGTLSYCEPLDAMKCPKCGYITPVDTPIIKNASDIVEKTLNEKTS
jgi:RNA polymerase subunit RPABC4/transcription elongation factor Spt4